ncbi:MAG: amidohydrolase family protein [Planctomycetes bacterium]|nr:amidohydrolase family protein [Planctomycetota bacterium]
MAQDTRGTSAGRPARIFDAHTHAFPDPLAATAVARLEEAAVWFPAQASFDGTAAGLAASMDRAGIDRAVVCSVATRPEQVPKITAWAAGLRSDRFVPFASVHPDFPDPEGEVERIAAAGVAGLKFHPQYMACPADDPRAERIARAAARAGLVMAFHAGHDMAYPSDDLAAPRRLRRLHERVPDLRLVACHMGGWQSWEEALEHVIGTEMYVETSMTLPWCPPALLERLFERHDPGRLLFGTDAPWADQAESLAAFLALPLAPDLKRRILWENALAFLGEAPAA